MQWEIHQKMNVREETKRMKKYVRHLLKDKGKCRQLLQDAGIMTKTGKLTKPYRNHSQKIQIAMPTIIWKIRNKTTGLFSKGGSTPGWNKTGKVWKQLSHLNAHFNHVTARYYADCEVVMYEINEVSTTPTQDFLDIAKQRKEAREARYEQERIAYRKAERLRMYEQLKEEFE